MSKLHVEFNGHYNEVFGDFGNLLFISQLGEVVYEGYKLGFKFPAEHTINGEKAEGEL